MCAATVYSFHNYNHATKSEYSKKMLLNCTLITFTLLNEINLFRGNHHEFSSQKQTTLGIRDGMY